MTQNTSSAVMAQRKEPHHSLDFFPTPPWATRALCEYVVHPTRFLSAWDPACGEGHMVRPLTEYFNIVHASDVHDYGFAPVRDFLFPGEFATRFDWIITNPPFRLGLQFIKRALHLADVGVAMLVRTAFLESAERYEELFSQRPPRKIAQFVERVPMLKGRYDPAASTATSYCWLVWDNLSPIYEGAASSFVWIPPCRKQLERPEDSR